jgi:hypothetical protein
VQEHPNPCYEKALQGREEACLQSTIQPVRKKVSNPKNRQYLKTLSFFTQVTFCISQEPDEKRT